MEEDGVEIPSSTSPGDFNLADDPFVGLVDAWVDVIRAKMEGKVDKKTLTIPRWLNDAVEKENINFLHSLQYAIKERLGFRKAK